MDAELRARPAPAEPSLESDPELLALIHDEIRRAGPMTFARFMELALYAPTLGYYMRETPPAGRQGDFLTAPETHPIFGAAIARHVAEVWRLLGQPRDFVIREYGAGSGALAASVLHGLATEAPELAEAVRYEAVEINPHRRAEIKARGPASVGTDATSSYYDVVLPATLDPAAAATSEPVEAAFVIANEFLDAFPVHCVEGSADGLREVFVDRRSDQLIEVLGPPSTPALAERLTADGVELEPGQRGEIALGVDDWVAEVGRWLQSGVVVVIDYGHEASDLYGPRRRNGTLMGYVEHRAIDDPLAAVGRQDLTAHVDLTALDRSASNVGFVPLASTTQAQYLLDLGLEDLLERARSDPGQTMGQYLELRSGVARLLDPRHTGGFRVVVLGRGIDPDQPMRCVRRLRT